MKQKFSVIMPTVLSFMLLLPLTLNKKFEAEAQTESSNYTIIKSDTTVLEEPKYIQTALEVKEPVAPIIEVKKVEVPKVTPVFADNPDKEYIKKRICEVWGPAQCANAIKIATLESGLRTNAKSPTNDYGVMQVNCTAHAKKVGGDCTKLYDLETNLRVAKGIYDASKGWSPWTTSKKL